MLPAQRRARKGGGALRATTKAGVAGNRLATIGAEFPFRPCEQARGRKGNSRQPFGFPGPPDTKPRLRRDTKTTASRSARKKKDLVFTSFIFAFLSLVIIRCLCQYPVSWRPKAVSCPREAGLLCPASDGTRRVAEGRGGGGRLSLTAAAPPNANRRSRSIAQPVFVVARSAPAPYFADFADFARDNQPRTISTQSRKERRARKDFWGRALAKPVRERPWFSSHLYLNFCQ